MRKFLTIVLSFIVYQHTYAQSRQVLNFNHQWQMFSIDSAKGLKLMENVRTGSDFNSQFNQETINNQSVSADSIRASEIKAALKGFASEYPTIKPLKWEEISLPHPARYEPELNPSVNQFVGICYYRKQFPAPADYKNKHLYIQFEGAMQVASVWINGKFVMQNQGGYLPFVVPLDGNIKAGNNEIIVRLDNNDNVNTPPGKALSRLGFLYWSGIYRNAQLVITHKIHITNPINANTVAGGGVFARSENISAKSADVMIKTQVKNGSTGNAPIIVKQILIHAKTQAKASSTETRLDANKVAEINQTIHVSSPKLWSPEQPNLYLLTTQIWSKGQLIDSFNQKIGIRKLSFTRTEGFKINDKPLKIVGTNRHQDFPYVGNAMSAAMQCRDMKRIKEAGFNFVRLSHYPQDPSIYRYCDSIGLMLGDAIPGWQFFNNNTIFKARVFSDIRQMIRRDRNHPSVIMWEASLNESYPPDDFRIASAKVAHEEYPGDNFFTAGDSHGAQHTEWDIPFSSWEEPFGRPQDVQPQQAGFAREYGDYEFGGAYSTTRANRSNGEKALLQSAWNLQWEHNLLTGPKYYPWTVGDAAWNFFDGFESFTKETSDWGVMDVYRLPKFSYYFFKSQLSPTKPIFGADNKPMVYIANWWTQSDTPQKVVVFSNCDEIALYLNGKLIRKQKPDAGADTEYGNFQKGGNPFDGGNAKNLPHAPFTFTNLPWQAGELKAVGLINGKAIANHVVNTPLQKTRLKLVVDDQGIPLKADGADAIFVHALLTDDNGTVMCLDNDTEVRFTLKGEGKIIGADVIKVRGGIASVLVRANTQAGLINLEASSNEVKKAQCHIITKN